MPSIEKIVADYETCKKAWDIGLRIDSVFAYYREDGILSGKPDLFFGNSDKTFRSINYTEYEYYKICDAPTAEEVPLPEQIYYNDRHFKCMTWFGLKATGYENFNDNLDFIAFSHNPNEATSRLQMAIWLCENVPEARIWYVNNKFLVENNNE